MINYWKSRFWGNVNDSGADDVEDNECKRQCISFFSERIYLSRNE